MKLAERIGQGITDLRLRQAYRCGDLASPEAYGRRLEAVLADREVLFREEIDASGRSFFEQAVWGELVPPRFLLGNQSQSLTDLIDGYRGWATDFFRRNYGFQIEELIDSLVQEVETPQAVARRALGILNEERTGLGKVRDSLEDPVSVRMVEERIATIEALMAERIDQFGDSPMSSGPILEELHQAINERATAKLLRPTWTALRIAHQPQRASEVWTLWEATYQESRLANLSPRDRDRATLREMASFILFLVEMAEQEAPLQIRTIQRRTPNRLSFRVHWQGDDLLLGALANPDRVELLSRLKATTVNQRLTEIVLDFFELNPWVLKNLTGACLLADGELSDLFRFWLFFRPFLLLREWGINPDEIGINPKVKSYFPETQMVLGKEFLPEELQLLGQFCEIKIEIPRREEPFPGGFIETWQRAVYLEDLDQVGVLIKGSRVEGLISARAVLDSLVRWVRRLKIGEWDQTDPEGSLKKAIERKAGKEWKDRLGLKESEDLVHLRKGKVRIHIIFGWGGEGKISVLIQLIRRDDRKLLGTQW